MNQLYVETSIEIAAPASRVWAVLTSPALNSQWSGLFGAKGAIDTDWKPGGPVNWRNAGGEVYVQGRVLAVEPSKRLQFSARSTNPALQPPSGLEADDITHTYTLSEQAGRTMLSVAHGDFSKLPNGEAMFPKAKGVWDQVLPRIRELAEQQEGRPNQTLQQTGGA